jgi:hypothetical protein
MNKIQKFLLQFNRITSAKKYLLSVGDNESANIWIYKNTASKTFEITVIQSKGSKAVYKVDNVFDFLRYLLTVHSKKTVKIFFEIPENKKNNAELVNLTENEKTQFGI